MKTAQLVAGLVVLAVAMAAGQDSVDVTFRYNISGFPGGISVPGEFNGWNNTAWLMNYQGGTLWIRNARLAVNPTGTFIPGAYQYKFFYNGASPWPNDPLNHHVNAADNDNTFIIVKDPTIYHFLPNQRTGSVSTSFPTISAYIFPKVGSTLDTAAVSLAVDGTVYGNIGSHYNFSTRQLTFTPPAGLANGGHTIILTAGQTRDTVSFIVAVGGPPLLALPAYARHGVTLPSPASNDSTTFRLRVSGSSYAILRVAPAGEPVASATPVFMRKDPVTDDWWMNLSLPSGTYEYLFQTSSGTLIYDPWGKYNGTYGTRFTIGPEGLTADDYVWHSTSYQKPPLNRLVIYELNVGEFAGGYYGLPAGQATFGHMKHLMGYFDSLGVNALELMPVNDYGLVGRSGHSWGYDLNSYFALEPGYGTPRDFKELVDSAHTHGIAIVIDAVFNHINDTGPLWQMQPDEATNTYFKLCSDLRFNEDQLCFFRDLDHWTPDTQELIFSVITNWIDVYHVDGFRYDFTQGIGWNIGQPHVGILGWANRVDSAYGGTIYQIAEHLPESPALLFYSGLTSGWHDSFRDEVFDEARFRNTSLTDFENLVVDLGAYPGNDSPALPNTYANRLGPVNATVNHDEQSLIYEMTQFQGVPLAEALVRDRLYATFIFASLGVPMLWEGMEFSEPRGWPTDGEKLNYRPVQFNTYRGTPRGELHEHYYKALIRQRKYNPALYRGGLRRLFRYNTEKTLVWGFEDTLSTAKVMAVANLSTGQQTLTNVPWLAPGTWYDIFTQDTLVVTGGSVPSITLPAYTAAVYSSEPDSILLDVAEKGGSLPGSFSLDQNFPNPFNPTTTIRFALPEGQRAVSLRVYDILGREVATLIDGAMAAGVHDVRFDGSRLSSGMYVYRLVTDRYSATHKLLLLR